ncbi:MAG: hypothetical protein M3X11_12620 [Acidobacteriota bacterium]|nr:hypothetical protein [Acidobacteriota bacterium]
MFIAILTILIGALLTAGGIQELVFQGILNSLLYPLIGGTLGTVAGALLLSAGIALLRQSPRATSLIRASALVCVPVFVLIGFIAQLAGWPVRIVGIVFPLFLLIYFRKKSAQEAGQATA